MASKMRKMQPSDVAVDEDLTRISDIPVKKTAVSKNKNNRKSVIRISIPIGLRGNTLEVLCPGCSKLYLIEDQKIASPGRHANCPVCKTRFFIRKSPARQPVRRESAPVPAPDTVKPEILKNDQSADRLPRVRKPVEKQPDLKQVNGFRGRVSEIFSGIFFNDMAVDLGTANTLVYIKQKGIVLNEASMVVMCFKNGSRKEMLAVGSEAKRMQGKTNSFYQSIRPLREGVIADFEAAGAMLCYFIKKVRSKMSIINPRIMIAVPSGITSVEKQAVIEAAQEAGARRVFLIEEPLAAAIGAGLPVSEPACNMVVDIGGGTTEIAVISLSGVVAGRSIRVAGDAMDDAIIRYIRTKYQFMIGENTAEKIKMTIGDACPDESEPLTMQIKGWGVLCGRPLVISVTSLDVRDAISDQLDAIVDGIRGVLEKTPQELSADAVEKGIVLTGGVALLKNLDQYICQETGLNVKLADNPLTTVALGTGHTMVNKKLFHSVVLGP